MNWLFITKMSSLKKRDVQTLSLSKKTNKQNKTKVNTEPAAVHDQRGLDLKDKTGIKHFPGRAKSVLMQHSSQISLM